MVQAIASPPRALKTRNRAHGMRLAPAGMPAKVRKKRPRKMFAQPPAPRREANARSVARDQRQTGRPAHEVASGGSDKRRD